MFVVDSVKLNPGHSEDELKFAAAKKAGIGAGKISEIKILRKSIDARDRENVKLVYNLALSANGVRRRFPEYVESADSVAALVKNKVAKPLRVAVIGAGPAGLMAALTLQAGGINPVLIERGGDAEAREKAVNALKSQGVLNTECNVQYGMGGAGLFSDGKLNSGISREYFPAVFGELVSLGAPKDILYESHPHVGTDKLKDVVTNASARLRSGGTEIKTFSRLDDIEVSDGKIVGIALSTGERLAVDAVILAIGHSAFDTFRMLASKGVLMEPKPFSVGVRIEHPQAFINEGRYGNFAPLLPPAEYKFSAKSASGRGVYTFCMCPGGEVIVSSSDPGTVVTNGMSYRARSGSNANAAILVSVTPSDFDGSLFGGFEFRSRIERAAFAAGGGRYGAPVQYLGDFIGMPVKNKLPPTVSPVGGECDLTTVLPRFVADGLKDAVAAFDLNLKGFMAPGSPLIGAETRSSCPVRILRGESGESSIGGIFPAGEGAGWSGGITSSAVDGVKAALKLMRKFGE